MDLKRFFKENVKEIKTEKVVVSDRFTDEDGKPLEWEIRTLSAREEETIRDNCTMKGKKGGDSLNDSKYTRAIITKAVKYPNLNDVELQNSYGVMSAEELLIEMLTAGEYIFLNQEVSRINGYGNKKTEMEEAVDEAKN